MENSSGSRPKGVRIAQAGVLALAVAAIAFTFAPGSETSMGGMIPVASRRAMPDFTMPDLGNQAWSLSSRRGRVVLVNFWATWCPPCRQEIPGFIRLAKNEPELEMAGVAMDEGGDAVVRQFVTSAGIPYPILLPPASSPFADSIQNLPTTFLLDKEGRIAKEYFGAVSETTVRRDVDSLLAEPRG